MPKEKGGKGNFLRNVHERSFVAVRSGKIFFKDRPGKTFFGEIEHRRAYLAVVHPLPQSFWLAAPPLECQLQLSF